MVTALVMAGGKGSRMNFNGEKPLIKINNQPMIMYVINALKKSKQINDIIIATSKNTPKTDEFLKNQGIKTILTPGKNYVDDLQYIISNFKLDDVLLTLTADLPLITGEIIDYVLRRYEKSSKPAMSVMIPEDFFIENNLKPTSVFENLVPSGLNILRSINKTQNEEVLILEKIELAVNINTCEDINLLKKLLGDSDE
ncbi:NTP transferase domain-containing protein [Methanobacterium oryzae]|uniref:NTP transferase domain-containing protein n=1 Tax=Methanobacterium oryzae TaxID=69540 RepID=UPI003D19C941